MDKYHKLDMGEELIGAGTLIERKGEEFLIVKEQCKPYRDKWTIPSGGYNKGETIRQTARRETKEETGLEVQLKGVIGFYFRDSKKSPNHKEITLVFKGEVTGGELLEDQNEIQNVKFSTVDEIQSLPLRFDITKIIEDYKQNSVKQIPIHHHDN